MLGKNLYDARKTTEIKHNSCKNGASILNKSRGDDQEMDMISRNNWKYCEGIKDVMEGPPSTENPELATMKKRREKQPRSVKVGTARRNIHKTKQDLGVI